jgi:thiol-disulfide isomerase/thioredoxin
MALFNKKEMMMLTPNDFEGKSIKGIKDGMLMVGASWCGYCQMVKPVWTQFRRFAGKDFPVMAVDAVAYPELAKRLGVKGYPTIFKVQNGKLKSYTGGRTLFDFVSEMCDLDKSHKRCKQNS